MDVKNQTWYLRGSVSSPEGASSFQADGFSLGRRADSQYRHAISALKGRVKVCVRRGEAVSALMAITETSWHRSV